VTVRAAAQPSLEQPLKTHFGQWHPGCCVTRA
jgi:hypothetical protein